MLGFTSAGYRVSRQGYGLQLVFSDGHERGIYPWAYLAQLTPVGASLLAIAD
ncbi:hypothetical protein PS938_03710 [Pseudomonas fluorescens]|uniref:Gamma-butyrobetaine hydroxylase-like N-terminal domain-containing protein n=1 Tax=Pseudomonas fluorescens TaxID=294 RepID=A0A5E7UMZ1_PSEFL|nr:hypothetical protein PS938_03710 [Pseudomonas fluorescens]